MRRRTGAARRLGHILLWTSVIGASAGGVGCLPPRAVEPEAAPAFLPADPEAFGRQIDPKPYWRRSLFRRFLSDQKLLVTTWWPEEFRRPSFASPLLVGTFAAATSQGDDEYGADLSLERSFDRRTTGTADRIAVAFTDLGNAPVAVVGLGAAYLVSRWSGNGKLGEATSLSAEALLDAGLWNAVLKKVTSRTRPAGNARGDFFRFGQAPPGQEVGSFPSGHAMGAFAVATVFAQVYSQKRWMPWLAYGTAGLIGASRVALGRHFPSDVVVGGVLGNSIGRFVVARGREDDRALAIDRIQPVTDPSRRAYGIAYRFTW